jgi:citrate lyase alpha subunit
VISPITGAHSSTTVTAKLSMMIRPIVRGRFISSLKNNAWLDPARAHEALLTAIPTTPTPAAIHAPLTTRCGCNTCAAVCG